MDYSKWDCFGRHESDSEVLVAGANDQEPYPLVSQSFRASDASCLSARASSKQAVHRPLIKRRVVRSPVPTRFLLTDKSSCGLQDEMEEDDRAHGLEMEEDDGAHGFESGAMKATSIGAAWSADEAAHPAGMPQGSTSLGSTSERSTLQDQAAAGIRNGGECDCYFW